MIAKIQQPSDLLHFLCATPKHENQRCQYGKNVAVGSRMESSHLTLIYDRAIEAGGHEYDASRQSTY